MNAFAQSMFDQLLHPDRNVLFHMRIVGGPGMDCSCRDFLHLRNEEQSLISTCLSNRQEPRILDIGCGIGRHSAFVRTLSSQARITVVEINQRLRDYCISVVPGTLGYEQFGYVPDDARFDIVFLMGNGLGVFGDEITTRQQLQRLLNLVADDGCVLIESGNFSGGSFYAAKHEIEYGGFVDGPFTWGYATLEWLQKELIKGGFEINSVTPSNHGGLFFICHATKRAGLN
jgi:SAM-dependent methyltransferase